MTKKQSKKTNPLLIRTIELLKKSAYENDALIWKNIAARLEKSSNRHAETNVGKLQRHLNENEVAIVPGKLLASGCLTKPVTVAAFNFSESARNKVIAAGGKCLSIDELIAANPKGTNVRVIV